MRYSTWLIVSLVVSISLITQPAFAAESTGTSATVDSIKQDSFDKQLVAKAQHSWPWYLTRAAGLVAAVSLVVLMLSGVGQITGHTFRFLEPLTAWASHRALGIAFGVSVLIHMGALLFDSFVSFGLLDILVPWLSDYRPVSIGGVSFGSLYVALGVLAFYVVMLIIISSLAWVDKKPATWKFIHLLSYLAILLVFVHSLYIGTDLAGGALRSLWFAGHFFVLFAVVLRLWRARTAA